MSRKAEFEEELRDDQRLLEEEQDPGMRKVIEEQIEHTKRVLVGIRRLVPDMKGDNSSVISYRPLQATITSPRPEGSKGCGSLLL